MSWVAFVRPDLAQPSQQASVGTDWYRHCPTPSVNLQVWWTQPTLSFERRSEFTDQIRSSVLQRRERNRALCKTCSICNRHAQYAVVKTRYGEPDPGRSDSKTWCTLNKQLRRCAQTRPVRRAASKCTLAVTVLTARLLAGKTGRAQLGRCILSCQHLASVPPC